MRRDIFQAIADPTRRAIIALIAIQALTPNSIADNFNSSRQAISKHLKILNECQIIKQEKKGREIIYSLNYKKIDEIDLWTQKIKDIWESRFNQLDDLLINLQKETNEK